MTRAIETGTQGAGDLGHFVAIEGGEAWVKPPVYPPKSGATVLTYEAEAAMLQDVPRSGLQEAKVEPTKSPFRGGDVLRSEVLLDR